MCMNDVTIFDLRSPLALWVVILIYHGGLTAAPLKFVTSLSGRQGFSRLYRSRYNRLVVKLIRQRQQYLSGKAGGVINLHVLIVACCL
jgi:hypothetical protein